ncbi:hypothetical protein RB195_004989 [Necator americanus]|uniref:Tyrosine-protein phosphatase domain-containing protein n=1 Tax=Necator americanus TaxID=51031 RepID=A0ABR1BKQ6_NECAM
MDKKKTNIPVHRKSKSTSRISMKVPIQQKLSEEEPVPPNTQVTASKRQLSKATSSVLPFGRPSLKKASTVRSRRRHQFQHLTVPPIRRCLFEKRESDSSSSHSVQDTATQLSKMKIIEKSRQRAKVTKKPDEDMSLIYESTTPVDSEEIDSNIRTACDVSVYERNITSCIKDFAEKCKNLTVDTLRNQFYSLPKPDPAECVVFGDPSNAAKNRYSNVPCLDTSRILLEFLLFEDGGGYIHANRVTYPFLRNQFILTQGPLPRTVPEFWRMIWQEKVETIIMLCKNVENGKRKCAEYFSNYFDIPSSYVNGQLTIFLRGRYQESDMIISTMELRYLSNSRTIIHYQWVAWPDCQAPAENVHSMFTMLRRVRGSKTPVGEIINFYSLNVCKL